MAKRRRGQGVPKRNADRPREPSRGEAYRATAPVPDASDAPPAEPSRIEPLRAELVGSPAARGPAGPVVEWLFMGFFALMVFGFVMFRLPGTMAAGNEMNVDRAVFTSVNAATLTGFQLNIGIGQFKPGNARGAVTLLVLTLGGTFFALTTAGLAATRVLRLRYTDGQVFLAATVAMSCAILVGLAPLISPKPRCSTRSS